MARVGDAFDENAADGFRVLIEGGVARSASIFQLGAF